MKIKCSRCEFQFGSALSLCPRCGQKADENAKPESVDTPVYASTLGRDAEIPLPDLSDSSSGGRIVLFIALVIVAISLAAAFSGMDSGSPSTTARPSPAGAPKVTTTQHYVTANALNLRAQPSASASVVGKADLWETLNVFSVADGWAKVQLDSVGTAYVSAKYLVKGNGRQAETQYCLLSSGSTPSNGEVLMRSLRSGGHELTVKGGSTPTVVKMKSSGGQDVLSFYVAPFNSVLIDNIPDGTYSTFFASGQTWSRSCERFVPSMQVSKDPNPTHLTVSADGRYYSALTYELTESVGGNFRPSNVSNDTF